MDQSSTPRVSCPYLNSYVGRNVLVVGKVVQLRGDSAIVDADGHITVQLNRESHLISGNAAQIVGKITPDLSIKVLSAQDLGLDVDLELSQKVVEVAQQNKSLFAYDG
ncbi:DNA replication factor a subunit ssb3 [Grosmannia clavigera kw1407]|uniref:DNA replication factor a subunit ssb3 n=1 Tax=Grosmannia clavigera (strain kw1407 / UAMH 11150) TaxID=655863 RepID=F0XE99_GROCL|nr:DNA replication factor a subunit ssb3 [Grosmannia clavigera kw1407]EFX04037.1 DNA replication factor a subunit ssb3 [Grosmannia clavigera kw1407]